MEFLWTGQSRLSLSVSNQGDVLNIGFTPDDGGNPTLHPENLGQDTSGLTAGIYNYVPKPDLSGNLLKPSAAGAVALPLVACQIAEPCGAGFDNVVIGAARITAGVYATKLTYKERDSESGLDDFPKRYLTSSMGRWMSPDPLPWLDWQHGNKEEREEFEDFIANPQNFNMYSYVNNNPLNKTDPTGMKGCQAGDKKFETYTITIVYDPKTSKGTITVTGQNKGDKDPTVLLTGSVVVGGDGHVTPTGTFTATTWEKDHVSTKYGSWANTKWSDSWVGKNVFGPFQLHIGELDKQGIMIHGTLGPSWSPTTWGNTVVGGTSHGCIRLCNQDDIASHNLMPNPRGNQIIIKTTGKPDDDDQ